MLNNNNLAFRLIKNNPGPLSAYSFAFSRFEGQSRPLKMNGYMRKHNQLLRVDELYRLVPQLTPFDLPIDKTTLNAPPQICRWPNRNKIFMKLNCFNFCFVKCKVTIFLYSRADKTVALLSNYNFFLFQNSHTRT